AWLLDRHKTAKRKSAAAKKPSPVAKPNVIDPWAIPEEEPRPKKKKKKAAPQPPTDGALAQEIRMRERAPLNPDPTFPLFSGVYTFPWYERSLRAWFMLSLGATAVGAGLKGVLALWPG